MTTTATNTMPAAALAANGQNDLDAAKDHLAALEKAAANGLEVNANDFNIAVTEVDLKNRRQAFLNKAHTAESATYAVALFDAADRMKTDADAHVAAVEAILVRAKRLAADIDATATKESHSATIAMGLPLVEDIGDLDGQLAMRARPTHPLVARGTDSGDAMFRLNGRGEELRSNFTRPSRG